MNEPKVSNSLSYLRGDKIIDPNKKRREHRKPNLEIELEESEEDDEQ